MDKIAPYAKALIGSFVAGLGALGTALTDESVTSAEWVAVATAVLVGLLAVFAVPNRDPQTVHQDESVQPPDSDPRGILGKA